MITLEQFYRIVLKRITFKRITTFTKTYSETGVIDCV